MKKKNLSKKSLDIPCQLLIHNLFLEKNFISVPLVRFDFLFFPKCFPIEDSGGKLTNQPPTHQFPSSKEKKEKKKILPCDHQLFHPFIYTKSEEGEKNLPPPLFPLDEKVEGWRWKGARNEPNLFSHHPPTRPNPTRGVTPWMD